MDDERLKRIESLFERAVELAGDTRATFLDEACGDDAALRHEIESLLHADESAGEFLEKPAVEPGFDAAQLLVKDDASGERVGPYRVLRQIGEGGMSDVHLAVRADDEYQKRVALKVIKHDLDREDMLRRFRTERQILAGLDHPNIATLLDGGSTTSGLPYYVMDFIDGQSIDEYCDSARLTVRERVELFRTVCSAVQYAHQNLVIHRDIKASNIMVTADGTPKLLDFGIAKLLKPDQFAHQVEYTATWARPMTPRYASPEQVSGRPVTTASDVYSLGVLLYKLLTGHLPYRIEGQEPVDLNRLVAEQEPGRPSASISRVETGPSILTPEASITPDAVGQARNTAPHQLQRQLSGDLDNVVLMALRKEPLRRYASAEQFSEDLRRYLRGLPVIARVDTFGYRASKFVKRNWIGVGVAAAFTVLLAGFAVTMAVQARNIALERDHVRLERDRAEQVVSFMKDLFAVSDPLSPRTEEVTAREILDRGAQRVREELQGQPETQASLMDAIGGVYRNLGLYDEARPLIRQALDTRRRVLDAPHRAVAESLLSLGTLERLAGNLDDSEPLLRESLDLRYALGGTDDPSLAPSLNHLGVTLRLKGEFEEAEALYRESIRIQEAMGGDHEELATALNNLATLMINMGRVPAETEPIFRRALEMRRRLWNANHPMIAQNLSNLGTVLGMQGKYDEAEPFLREALVMHRALLDPKHPALVESLNNLGKLLHRKGDAAAALPLYEEALAIERDRAGEEHPKVGHIYTNLATVHRDLGQMKLAEDLYRKSLDLRRRMHGDEHPDVGRSLAGLADLLNMEGRAAEAEPLATEAVTLLTAALPDHWWTANARSVLGGSLVGTERFAEAEPLLLEAHEALSAVRGPEHPATVGAQRRLFRLYEAWGRPEKAAAYRPR